MNNRSVPVNTLLPHLVYDDVAKAILWLSETFGFTESFRYGDPEAPNGAQMRLGQVWVMLSGARAGRATPTQLGAATQILTLLVDDAEACFHRITSRGAEVWEDLHETVYGELQFGVYDLAGHPWIFSQHVRDLAPEDWGAKTVEAHTVSHP